MGLFKMLFGTNKPKSSQSSNKKNDLLQNYDDLKRKTEELRKANDDWQKEFSKLIEIRNIATALEKENKKEEALEKYLKAIELGESSSKLNINNYLHDIDRVIIIYSKNNNTKLLVPFLQRMIKKYPEVKEVNKWQIRLAKLENKSQKIDTSLSPKDISEQNSSNPTLGKQLQDFRLNMPEFNFYYDLPEGSDTLQYQHNVRLELFKKHRVLKDRFSELISEGQLYEKRKDFKNAIETYEKLVVEEYPGPEPHERLIIIYSKLNWKEKEKSAIKRAITTFETLKENQKNYVLSLAAKYNMTDKALEYIDSDKKIFYFGGAFELYNPQKTRIEKWQKRLNKLES